MIYKIKFQCPDCGSQKLTQIETADIVISSVDFEVEDGEVYPVGNYETHQEGSGNYTYACGKCYKTIDIKEIIK